MVSTKISDNSEKENILKYSNLKKYLERAKDLLDKKDSVSLGYCALELRRGIELIVWTQFKDAFYDLVTLKTSIDSFKFKEKTQSQSISKMYEMLKKYCPEYSKHAQQKSIWTFKSSYGDAPSMEVGKTCYIPSELPNSDYKYLSEILHYEKEFYPEGFRIDSTKLRAIHKRLKFIEENYTMRLMPIQGNQESIIKDFKETFHFNF